MGRKVLINTLILLLASVFVFLALGYIVTLREKVSSLRDNISLLENQKQNLLREIEKEKMAVQQLSAKNSGLKGYLQAAVKRLNNSFVALDKTEEKLDKLGAQFSILKAENSALLKDRGKLAKDNEVMKARLNSVDELKKALRRLKKEAPIEEGNRGFLIKDGQPTFPAKVKIEVIPAPGQ